MNNQTDRMANRWQAAERRYEAVVRDLDNAKRALEYIRTRGPTWPNDDALRPLLADLRDCAASALGYKTPDDGPMLGRMHRKAIPAGVHDHDLDDAGRCRSCGEYPR